MKVGMFEGFMTRHWFDAEAKALWSDTSMLQAWLDVEAALASAQAEHGLIPADAAATIASKARAERFDLERLAADIGHAQHPLVPVLRQLEELCAEPAAGFVHWGATTQNIFDTASALLMHRTHRLLIGHLETALDELGRLALVHRNTVQAGRTHGQHALPMTFGFKVATWMDELARDRDRLAQRIGPSFPACVGGAIGTHAAMGSLGPRVEARVAELLQLESHGLASRASYDRAADYIAALGLLAGTAQRIAQDIVFMQRTEIAEAAEAFHVGKMGSSTMAQKRNPSTALLLVSLARMLRGRIPMALEATVRMDEGDSSATNVTDVLLPDIGILAVSVAATAARLVRGLVVNAQSMRRHLDSTGGLIVAEAAMMRLSPVIGRHHAHDLLYAASQHATATGCDLLQALQLEAGRAGCSLPPDLAASLDASVYTGCSEALTLQTVQRITPHA